MIFKNAFYLTIDNFALNYKLLLYKAAVWVITFALSMAFLYAPIVTLLNSRPMAELVQLLGDFVKALTSGDTAFLSTFADSFQVSMGELVAYLQRNTPSIVLFALGLLAILLISRFLDGIGNFTFGCLIDNRLSSYAKTPFMVTCIGNLSKSALWQIVYVPVTFVYDVCSVFLCYGVFLILINIISVELIASAAALMVSATLLLAAQALKLTIFNDVVPAIVADKMRLRDALKKAFSCKAQRFAGLFSTYLVTVLLIMCVNVLFAVATFGAGLLITIPMSYLIMTCIQFVSYYDDTHKKYFLGEDNIVRPKERTNENFYDDFEL